MQITNIGSGDGGKNSNAVYYFIFWDSFHLIFLNIASCRDLSPNRPFQEPSVYHSINQASEILTCSVLGWNLGVQNVITYHRTLDYIYYIFFLIFFRIQKTKEEQSALLKTSSAKKKIRFDSWSILCDGKNAFRYFTKPGLKCRKSGKTKTFFENLKVKQISLNKIFVLYSNRVNHPKKLGK